MIEAEKIDIRVELPLVLEAMLQCKLPEDWDKWMMNQYPKFVKCFKHLDDISFYYYYYYYFKPGLEAKPIIKATLVDGKHTNVIQIWTKKLETEEDLEKTMWRSKKSTFLLIAFFSRLQSCILNEDKPGIVTGTFCSNPLLQTPFMEELRRMGTIR